MAYEYRVVWRREGMRTRSTIRQTLAAAERKADWLRGEFTAAMDGGYGGIVEVPGVDFLSDRGVPQLVSLRIERREVGAWDLHSEGVE